jgi:ABC-type branched-subunit amino acid transport system ATPase component
MPTSSGDLRPSAYLAARAIVAGYGGVPVVTDVSLDVGLGEIAAVLGANGAGKSTALKAIIGELEILQGSVVVDGRPVTNMPTDELARQGVGYVPQSDDVFDTLTVDENLAMGGYALDKDSARARATEIIDLFPALGRMSRRVAGRLSGGERKMLAIGRALMLDPKLLVLDEPTAGLTEELARTLLSEHLVHLASTGRAVLIVEQRAAAVLAVADWSFVLVGGKTVISSSARELMARGDIGEVLLGFGPQTPNTSPQIGFAR